MTDEIMVALNPGMETSRLIEKCGITDWCGTVDTVYVPESGFMKMLECCENKRYFWLRIADTHARMRYLYKVEGF